MISLEPGLHRVEQLNIGEILQMATDCQVFTLSDNIDSKVNFFQSVKSTLPLDPVVQSNSNWDALSDSLWAGLDELNNDTIVILWPNARKLQVLEPDAFSISSEILVDISNSLGEESQTGGETKRIIIIQEV